MLWHCTTWAWPLPGLTPKALNRRVTLPLYAFPPMMLNGCKVIPSRHAFYPISWGLVHHATAKVPWTHFAMGDAMQRPSRALFPDCRLLLPDCLQLAMDRELSLMGVVVACQIR
eukprot:scaffold107004_cov33-Tisochrysis_lutea.AAC.7